MPAAKLLPNSKQLPRPTRQGLVALTSAVAAMAVVVGIGVFGLQNQQASQAAVTNTTWGFFGDSITQAGAPYVAAEFAKLNTGQTVTVVNRAVGGTKASQAVPTTSAGYMANPNYPYTNSQFLQQIDALPADGYVVLGWGTNDLWTDFDRNNYRANMRTLIQQVIAKGRKPMVPTVIWNYDTDLSNGDDTAWHEQQLNLLNGEIAALRTEFGAKLLVGPDLYTYFRAKRTLYADGVHLTSAGYTQWAAQYAAVMKTTVSAVLPGDATGDGRVNALDLSILITKDGQNYLPADFNKDGTVGAADLSILLGHWTW